jgi:ATP-binding cassette subfamily B protein
MSESSPSSTTAFVLRLFGSSTLMRYRQRTLIALGLVVLAKLA